MRSRKKMVCNTTYRRRLFAIIGVSGLSILTMTYYTDIINITSTSAVERVLGLTELGNLKSIWTKNNNNTTEREQFEDDTVLSSINTTSSVLLWNQQHHNLPDDGKLSTVLVTNSTRVLQNRSSEQANNSRHTFTEIQSGTTTMTFNTTLVVHCMKSPFIECTQTKVAATDQKTYQISLLRRPDWLPMTSFAMEKCQFNQCTIRETTVTMETDVVFVHGVWLDDSFRPPERWPHQIYVLALWESTIHMHAESLKDDNSVWKNQFNLTMTYRLDADIFTPYGMLSFSPQPLDKRPNYYEIAKRKTRTAVWIVSHCRAPSKRDNYVSQMQKYVDVDILGGCTGHWCNTNNWLCNNMDKYKFYLSFENSLCRDYVTEKLFKLFAPGMHVIPVVRGGADYDKYFPKFTYINASHFKSPKDLALYLKDLASDLETYSKYLEYKDLYVGASFYTYMGCSMCKYLHTHKLSEQKRCNFSSWDNDCHGPTDL